MADSAGEADECLHALLPGRREAAPMSQWIGQFFQVGGRVCLIYYPDINGGLIQGTGFLVGPNLVMTNFHVVENAFERKLPGEAIRVRFDYTAEAPTLVEGGGGDLRLESQDWLRAFRPYSESDKHGREPFAQADQLDYAVLQLADSPGREPIDIPAHHVVYRGWFVLADCRQPVSRRTGIHVVQHLRGKSIHMSKGYVLEPNAETDRPFRLHHDASTEPGSSGSPCFADECTRLVAVHHAGDALYPFSPQRNQAIPIQLIAEDLTRQSKQHLVDQPEVPRAVPLTSKSAKARYRDAKSTVHATQRAAYDVGRIRNQLFIGRERLRDYLWQFVENSELAGNAVLITGPSASGKSHSWPLIRHVACLSEGVAPYRLHLGDRPADQRTIADVYGLLQPRFTAEKIASPLADDPPASRAIGRVLDLLPRLLAQSPSIHWLVIDGLDDPATPDETVLLFYRLAIAIAEGDIERCSIFLLGQLRSTGEEVRLENLAYCEHLVPLAREELVDYVLGEAIDRQVRMARREAETVVDEALASVSTPPVTHQMQRAMVFLREAIDRLMPKRCP